MKIRTRFAPSPTGFLHVGGLRTALFDYLFARKMGGDFVLRIEDTDRERLVDGAVENIVATLSAFGIAPDEGPTNPGAYGPYTQSERLSIYRQHAEQLIAAGKAYYCFCPAERLEKLKEDQRAAGVPPRYDGNCRDLSQDEIAGKLEIQSSYVVRQKVPRTGVTEYEDVVHGRLQFRNDLLDDSILMKSDGYPVYNFANVVDDHLMEITHVLRGEEFLSSTPKHVLLYQAFGWQPPQFVHLPLILDTQRKKLSKRTGDVAVDEYVKKGYIKEALLNFVALLGWNPKSTQEIFSLDELVKEFDLSRLNKSGAIFDIAKLDFLDRQWRRRLALPPESDPLFSRTFEMIQSRVADADRKVLIAIWPQITQRITGPSVLEQGIGEFLFYFRPIDYPVENLLWKSMSTDRAKETLSLLRDFLHTIESKLSDSADIETQVKDFLVSRNVPLGEALWPLRVALSGQKQSPNPFEICAGFSNSGMADEIFSRINAALDKLT